ncbi:hypothetical protein [Amycolatopsis alkalitolerans]|uniref:DUF3558 domain-containing protein n=1 Tax=Amycolatopsis alkalitolerans TaxID=2547244 RepID=A0A5C4LVU9_9PSEU|nr:hypothetical protein [Amycolatopsis alkalitolerans]TNC23542.1 hypothetical protein FG385_21175 [Amycolatopsis alkalitolerans]
MRSKVFWFAVLAAAVTLAVAGCTESVPGRARGSTAPASSTTGGAAITVATMHVTLPEGMHYTKTSSGDSLDGCLTAHSVTCAARMLDLRAASGDPQFDAPSASRPYGWYTGSGAPRCVTPSTPPGAGPAATGSTVVQRGFAPIGPKTADYARWHVTCTDPAQDSEIRMWWLPVSKILVLEYASTPALDQQIDRILAGATFDQ